MILRRLATPFLICFLLLDCNTNPSDFIVARQGSTNPAPLPQPTIVLLHGLCGSTVHFNVMKDRLQKELPTGVTWLALEEPRTAEDTIDVQAESTFKQLKEKNVSKNTPLIFIGHSQGGLKAYRISEKYGKVLNIKGIVTIGTPWESTPLLEDSKRSLLLTLLPKLPQQETLKKQIESWAQHGKAGIEDIKPDSDFLKKVQKSLQNNQTPIFAIAGKTTVPSEFVPIAQLIFDTADHDCLVPVDSQLAKNIDVNTKTFQRNVPVVGAAHFPINWEKFALDNPQIIQLIKAFCGVFAIDNLQIIQLVKASCGVFALDNPQIIQLVKAFIVSKSNA